MGSNNFEILSDSELRKSITDITMETSKIKNGIFKNIVMGKPLDTQGIKQFESAMNAFLRRWTDYGNQVKAAISTIKIGNCEGMEVVDFTSVKNSIFGKYDYASILPFTDGVIKGIQTGSIKNPSQIESFKDHTITMAFNKQPSSVGALLDAATSESLNTFKKKATELDIKNFESVQHYKDLLNAKERCEIYQSIVKVIEYITDKGSFNPNISDNDTVKLYISMLSSICDYMSYSLSLYATRIFVISKYILSFTSSNSDKVVTESVDTKRVTTENISENPNGSVSSVFHNTDEMMIKDPKRIDELIVRINDFLKAIAAKPIIQGDDRKLPHDYNVDKKWRNGNKLYDKLKNNLFYDFFVNDDFFHFGAARDRQIDMVEVHDRLKTIMYNDFQGFNNSITAKNEFMNLVRDFDSGSSSKECKTVARDIAVVFVDLGCRIAAALSDKTWQLEEELGTGSTFKPWPRKSISEMIRFLIDVYEETMFMFAQKLQYFEAKINKLQSSEIKKVIDITSLNIPGLTSDLSNKDSMMLSSPDTIRTLTESVDLYALPIFEGYQMYDAYLKSLPMFESDIYFKEVADTDEGQSSDLKDKIVDQAGTTISGIINRLRSIIQALWQRIQSFWNNQSFVLARKWVIDNESMLASLQFTDDVKMQVLPYKEDITLPGDFSNLPNNMMNFDANAIASSDALQKYLHTLYPNDQIAQWFANDTTGKVAPQQYMNLILFDNGSEEPKTAITITGKDIPKYLATWIDTIKSSNITLSAFEKINTDINNAVGSINTKIVNITNQAKQTAAQQTPDSASTNASQANAADNSSNQQNQTNSNQNQTVAAPTSSTQLVMDAATKITSAITRLWSPLAPMIIRAMMNQYSYVKTAYGLGTPGPQSHTPEDQQTQQNGQL